MKRISRLCRLHKARISVREAVSRQYEELDVKREYVTSCVVVTQGSEIARGGGSVSRNRIEWRQIIQDEGVFFREDRLYHVEMDYSVSSGPPRGNMADGLPRAYTFSSSMLVKKWLEETEMWLEETEMRVYRL